VSKFAGKVAVITGGAAGIGRATATLLSSEGATVVIADRDVQSAEKVASDLPGDSRAIEFDATDHASITALVDRTVEAFGRIDILHNNVGVTTAAWTADRAVVDTPVEVWDMIMSVNVRSHFLASQAVIPHMLEQGGGAIINMASVAGFRGAPGLTTYGVSKAAVMHLTQFTAVQYGPQNIRVNCIAPGVIKTQQLIDNAPGLEEATLATLPFSRVGEPEDIAAVVAFLASDEAAFINGEIIRVDGGGMAGQNPRTPA
jgi:NAD(P)-dependent dehydrogenase (short-subunit alcohol dehydrogenase family)